MLHQTNEAYSGLNILDDDLSQFTSDEAPFVTMGETMLRDTPADLERLERTRQVWLSPGGSELTVAVMLNRLGIPAEYITRLPDNPYGWMVRNIAREQGVKVDHLVWAEKTEPIGRYLYELGRTPRSGVAWYQRKYSAASRLGAGMVAWPALLREARLLHTSGITFGLAPHSGYERNYLLEAFQEALAFKPAGCRVGLDFNYRSTLWNVEQCRAVMTSLIEEHVDILIITLEDLFTFYGISCGGMTTEAYTRGELEGLPDDALGECLERAIERFHLQVAAVTLRYADSHEQHRWESVAMDSQRNFYRSAAVRPVVLQDRLGGGDAWVGGFYYGLLTEADPVRALQKGVLVGDAATRLKQTLMYDLPVISRQDIQSLLWADVSGGGRRVTR